MKIIFILLVLVLLVGCSEEAIIDEGGMEDEQEVGGSDTGIDDVFGEGGSVEPPPAPS